MYLWIQFALKHFSAISEVLAEGSPRPLSSVPDVTHHLVTMQSGRQSYEVSVLTAVNPQEVKLSLALTLFLWRLIWQMIRDPFLETLTRISSLKMCLGPASTGS